MQYIIGACYHAFSLPKIRDNNNGPITPQHTLKIEGMQFVMLSTMLCVQKYQHIIEFRDILRLILIFLTRKAMLMAKRILFLNETRNVMNL